MNPQGYVPDSNPSSTGKTPDIQVAKVVRVMVILGGMLVIIIGGTLIFFRQMELQYPGRGSEAAPLVRAADLPPLPRLQTDPLRDLQAVRALEASHLDHYGWMDEHRGLARIPINRAMVLWVKNPDVPPAPSRIQSVEAARAQEVSHAP